VAPQGSHNQQRAYQYQYERQQQDEQNQSAKISQHSNLSLLYQKYG
jgi:hypothetical protein